MGYKMKRGAKPKFSELGSSPVKQKPGGIKGEAIDHWNKYKKIKTQNKAIDKLLTDKNISKIDFERKLAKITNTVNPYPKTKAEKNFDARQASKQKGKDFVKNLKTKGDLVSKKPSGNIAQAFKTTAGKVLGGLGVAATLYDFYKSGQKHSGGKAVKGQKTGVVAPKTSIWNKKK